MGGVIFIPKNNEKERKTMKNLKYKVILGACAVAIGILFGSGKITTQAATPEKTKALKAYNTLMAKEKISFHSENPSITISTKKCTFGLAQVDNDGIPELIVNAKKADGTNHATGYFNVYTFKSGKLKYAGNAADKYAYFPKIGISHSKYIGQSDTDQYYDLNDGELILCARDKEKEHGNITYFGTCRELDVDNSISKAEYTKLYNKYTKDVKEKVPTYHANTAYNRSVFLLEKPGKAGITSLKKKGTTAAVVKIKKAKNATAYKIQYSTNSKFKKAKSKATKKTTYKLTKLKRGKTYYVRVCGYKKNGKSKSFGKWSTVKKVKISKKTPDHKEPKNGLPNSKKPNHSAPHRAAEMRTDHEMY